MTIENSHKMATEGVTYIPDLAYREGNEAWKLDLAMPEDLGESPRPAILFIHGGGWRNGDKRAGNFIGPTLEFARKGYVCVSVNYRMLDEGPITNCVEDVKNAVRWLRANAENYNVDTERIGAYGNSAGAHLSVMLGVCPPSVGLEGDGPHHEYSSMIQAVVASATPTDFLGPMSNRQRNPDAQNDPRPNRPASEPDEIRKKVSPMTYVSADAPPILLIHEISDQTVGVWHSDDFVKALREAGAKDVSYVLLGDKSGHGAFMSNIDVTGPAREAFFRRTLMCEEEHLSSR